MTKQEEIREGFQSPFEDSFLSPKMPRQPLSRMLSAFQSPFEDYVLPDDKICQLFEPKPKFQSPYEDYILPG